MTFQAIAGRVSLLSLAALLPAAALAGVAGDRVALQKEGVELIRQVEEVGREIEFNAERLQIFSRGMQLSRGTHVHHLSEIRTLVNESLRPALDRLAEIQPQLPDWKQESVDRMLHVARKLALDANSAILVKNEARTTPALMNGDYRELVDRIVEHAGALVKTSDAASTYAAARLKAVAAGVRVPMS